MTSPLDPQKPAPLNLRQRMALIAWMFYWISFLIPVVSDPPSAPGRKISYYAGWYTSKELIDFFNMIGNPDKWRYFSAKNVFTGMSCTLNVALMLGVYLFVRRAPSHFQSRLYLALAFVNLSMPMVHGLDVEFGYFLWVSSFGLVAIALRQPQTGRPIQFSLGVLFLGVLLGASCALPIMQAVFKDYSGVFQAVTAVLCVLFLFLPGTVVLGDILQILRERRKRQSVQP